MDVIRGDQTLFMRGDEVEATWALTDPIIANWEGANQMAQPRDPGTSGPDDALVLSHNQGGHGRATG